METPGSPFRRRLPPASPAVLAAEAAVQRAWLVEHGVPAEETALDFDHAFRMAGRLVAEGPLVPEVMDGLREIDMVPGGTSGGESAERWTEQVLFDDDGWARARHLARRVLVTEPGDRQQPLPRITVVR
ncbi:hypothetical protein [Streptomyces sp. NPDC093094]|uniref:hypothetical protein n=1 Tax=Streptomyces sp. NPDC093094 TaxID=3366026 RepID=UPI00381A5BE5